VSKRDVCQCSVLCFLTDQNCAGAAGQYTSLWSPSLPATKSSRYKSERRRAQATDPRRAETSPRGNPCSTNSLLDCRLYEESSAPSETKPRTVRQTRERTVGAQKWWASTPCSMMSRRSSGRPPRGARSEGRRSTRVATTGVSEGRGVGRSRRRGGSPTDSEFCWRRPQVHKPVLTMLTRHGFSRLTCSELRRALYARLLGRRPILPATGAAAIPC
jgi:hypothetical protein